LVTYIPKLKAQQKYLKKQRGKLNFIKNLHAGGRGKGEEMTQTLYAHMNKRNLKKKKLIC
jgi:hypothetical protein